MKTKTVILFCVLFALPMMAHAQTTLNFPRLFTASDRGSTGFGIANPGPTNATVLYTLYGTTGATLGTSTKTAPARGALQPQLGSDLFPGITQAGWVRATSTASGLQGFWLGGDFSTFTDGADGAPEALDLVFPLVGGQTEINLANIGAATNSVTMRLYDTPGTVLSTATRSINANGVLQEQVSSLFPGVNLATATHVRATGSGLLTGTSVIDGYLVSPSWGAANGVDATSLVKEANFPQAVHGVGGGGNWTTVVDVVNLSSLTNAVTLTFTPIPSQGPPIVIQQTIAASGSVRATLGDLFFAGQAATYHEGWIKVTAAQPITGAVVYADSAGRGLAVVPVQATPRTNLLFAHIADGPPQWNTGIGLLNANAAAATVDVFALNSDGTLIGGAQDFASTAHFSIPAGEKFSALLRQLIPPVAGHNSGFVFLTSTVPLYGSELFFTTPDLAIISNVSAGTVPAGITYTPPAPAGGPLTLTSVNPSPVVRGASLTLAGTGFNPAATNSVVFASGAGTVSASAATATATSLTVAVPGTAITGPVLVQTGSQSSNALILQVAATATTQVQTNITVSAGVNALGADIYVPAPAGSLNATAIGAFDASATSFSTSTSAVELTRGVTKELAVNGSGLSAANGTTLTISGPGITVSNLRYASGTSGILLAHIVIDAAAAVGPRNVVVTNTNLDTTVLTGGVIIR